MARRCDGLVKVTACVGTLTLAAFVLWHGQNEIVLNSLQLLNKSKSDIVQDGMRRLRQQSFSFDDQSSFGTSSGGEDPGVIIVEDDSGANSNPISGIFGMAGYAVGAFVVTVLFNLPVAWFYYDRVTRHRKSWTSRETSQSNNGKEEDFSQQCKGCCDDCDYFCAGCTCLLLRAADTVHTVGVWSFWPFLLVLVGVQTLGSVIDMFISPGLGSFCAWCAMVAIFAVSRAKIRAALGLSSRVTPYDAVVWCFCPWCAAIQEAREVDKLTDTKIVFCCALAKSGNGPTMLVGDAVGLE